MKTSIETHVPLSGFPSYPEDEMRIRARAFHDSLATRRAVRAFSDKPVPREIIEACVAAAGSAAAAMAEVTPGMIFLKAGTLDDTSWLQPDLNMWCETAQSWVAIDDKLPQ